MTVGIVMKNYLIKSLKKIKLCLVLLSDCWYDAVRFFRYSGMMYNDARSRGYKLTKLYHKLEKGMSFNSQRRNAGINAADSIMQMCTTSNSSYADQVALDALGKYVNKCDLDQANLDKILDFLKEKSFVSSDLSGVHRYTQEDLHRGVLSSPEDFFLSRFSIRSYAPQVPSMEIIERAVILAMKSPSVCNRQGWGVICIDNKEVIKSALKLQNGNAGFGHEVPMLLILTSDLKAFDVPSERNQGWIDGGMFSMSLVWALHSLGLASCCLNWSRNAKHDLLLREVIRLPSSNNVLMMLAVGFSNAESKVCQSQRNPHSNIITRVS